MNKSLITLILIFTIIFVIITFFYSGKESFGYSDLKVGKISNKTILSPFDFDVLKPKSMINSESKKLLDNLEPIYYISEEINFEIYKRLNSLYEDFSKVSYNNKIKEKLLSAGFNKEDIDYLKNKVNRLELYKKISQEISKVLEIGIYSDSLQTKNIKLKRKNGVFSFDINRLYSLNEAINKLSIKFIKFDFPKKITKDILNYILIPNIVYDSKLTGEIKQKVINKIDPVYMKILKNEEIIRKNQKITELDLLKIKTLEKYSGKENNLTKYKTKPLYIFSLFIVYLILNLFIAFTLLYLKLFDNKNVHNYFLIFTITGILLVTYVILNKHSISPDYFPYSFPIFLTYFIYKNGVQIPFSIYFLLILAIFPNLNTPIINISILTSLFSTIIVSKMGKDEHTEIFSLFWIFNILFFITSITFFYITYHSFTYVLTNYFYLLISATLSFLMAALIYPTFQKRVNIVNKQILLDLINYDNPLLKKMAKVAPGTYHHSLIVGNLSESAAESINADPLLARVGSYYHDIGKISEPEIFIENNSNSLIIHSKLTPEESAAKIKNHINAGVNLATDYKLPKIVIDIIKQHHGNSAVKYFLNKAKKNNNEINISDFTYDGPLPKSKEAAIVMIADVIESTAKSLKNPNAEEIKKVIDNSIKNLILEGQLIETQLTLRDLEEIKETFIPILEGIYRPRVEYK